MTKRSYSVTLMGFYGEVTITAEVLPNHSGQDSRKHMVTEAVRAYGELKKARES